MRHTIKRKIKIQSNFERKRKGKKKENINFKQEEKSKSWKNRDRKGHVKVQEIEEIRRKDEN